MTSGYDLIALSVITTVLAAGGAYLATRPVRPSKRDEREKALLEKLEEFDEWLRLESAPALSKDRTKQSEILELDAVALLEAIPELLLVRGQVGTVLEALEHGLYLVEFARAKDGVEIATVAIDSTKLLKLCHEPTEENKLPGDIT